MNKNLQTASERSSQMSILGWLLTRTGGVRFMWGLSICARIANQLLMTAILVLASFSVYKAYWDYIGTFSSESVFASRGNVPLSSLHEALLSLPLSAVLMWMLGLSLVKALLRYLEHYAGHWVAFTMLARLRTEFYRAIVPQAPAITKGNAAAELSERATRDIDRVEVFFAHTIPPALSAIIVPTIVIVWAGNTYGWVYAVIMGAASLLMVCLPSVGRLLSWHDQQLLAECHAQIATHLGDSIQGVREILSFGAEDHRLSQWRHAEKQAEAVRRRIRLRSSVRSGLLLSVELGALIALVGAFSAYAAPLSQGAPLSELALHFVSLLLMWVSLWAPLRGVDDFVDGLDEAIASAERVRRTIETLPLVTDKPPVDDKSRFSGENSVTNSCNSKGGAAVSPSLSDFPSTDTEPGAPVMAMRSVFFSYDGRTEHVHDISIELPEGSWTYVAGVSGSGKSTIGALLARGWDPERGSITYRGIALSDYPLAQLRSRVALVAQRPSLLSASVKENLLLSNPDAHEDKLWEALHVVGLDQWVRSHTDGLLQPIATEGVNVSGGQMQRLAIARALVCAPDVLILDEATSQLDEETARLIRQRLRQTYPRLTVLEISHHVNRIPDEAPVLVIDAGRLVENGTAAQLREIPGGFFQRLLIRV
ncbi:amino acid ABC transporter ATP-binding/permease protein [Schaalia sp. lx-100]|uniref:amino acid ABC transporter ATP-binding/permease protein n=1 Tax=Schaalia sp. lx-100 TaxID=2899081 RepID=UPI001E333B11|nr:ABC transporter ATP-binding protein [Schaalia sp. lx-100]MCD4557615.1 ABC transporter ATP-binding protein/permease [Schaalia sp. lx-100]